MGADDWLLNLCIRCRLHHEPDSTLEATLHELGSVLRRTDMFPDHSIGPTGTARWEALVRGGPAALSMVEFLDELAPWHSGSEFGIDRARKHGTVKSGVRAVGVSELFFVEGRLPDDVRAYGVANRPPTSNIHHDAPSAYMGTLNDALAAGEGSQRLGRFVVVDLALPDDVLHADLQSFLAGERERLRQIGGEQPYREAAESRRKPSRKTFKALAAMCLLQYLDLSRWNRRENVGLSDRAVQEMAGAAPEDRGAELRDYAATFMHPHHLIAWFARAERSVKVEARR